MYTDMKYGFLLTKINIKLYNDKSQIYKVVLLLDVVLKKN